MARMYKRPEISMMAELNGQSRIPLSRNYHVTHLLCKLTVTHTNGTTPVFNEDDLYSLINKVEIVGNGNQNLKSIKGKKLKLNTVLGFTTTSKSTLNTIASGAGKESTVWFTIMFNLSGTIRGHDTILNTALYTNLDMLIDWSGADAVGSDITVTSAKIDTYSNALIGYKRNQGETIKYYKEIQMTEPIVNSADEHTITLPTKKIYKSLILHSTVDGVPSDAVINNITLKSGTTVIMSLPYDAVQVENELQYKPQDINDLKGIAVIDFAQRGRLSDLLDTTLNEFNTLELVLNVTKSGTDTNVTVFTDEIQNTSVIETK